MGLFDRSRRKREEPERVKTETEPEDSGEEQQVSEAADWYRAMYSDVLPAGDDVVLQIPERRTPVLIPAFEFDLLAHCLHFATVEEHAAAAASRTGLPADGVCQNLYELGD